ncbi:MAG: TIGR00282 family metallophosphoesterase [Aquificota bacterium]|nr:TIGR00282 family metallophosphoesterase [Aquificota bacterium]
MRFLIIGDIVGRPGRRAVARVIDEIRETEGVDAVIANVENAAGGFGITKKVYEELKGLGIDVFTSGNHIWDKKEVLQFIDGSPDLLRPANYPDGVPGRGYGVFEKGGRKFAVINLMGRVFMDYGLDNPFRVFDRVYETVSRETRIVVVDFHGEATSEKWAFAIYADGRASVVYGTHTHVPTADEMILKKGTAYVTDIGMTGPLYSVIGMRYREPIERFLLAMPRKFQVEEKEDVVFNAVIVEVEEDTGRAVSIKRIKRLLTWSSS